MPRAFQLEQLQHLGRMRPLVVSLGTDATGANGAYFSLQSAIQATRCSHVADESERHNLFDSSVVSSNDNLSGMDNTQHHLVNVAVAVAVAVSS